MTPMFSLITSSYITDVMYLFLYSLINMKVNCVAKKMAAMHRAGCSTYLKVPYHA